MGHFVTSDVAEATADRERPAHPPVIHSGPALQAERSGQLARRGAGENERSTVEGNRGQGDGGGDRALRASSLVFQRFEGIRAYVGREGLFGEASGEAALTPGDVEIAPEKKAGAGDLVRSDAQHSGLIDRPDSAARHGHRPDRGAAGEDE